MMMFRGHIFIKTRNVRRILYYPYHRHRHIVRCCSSSFCQISNEFQKSSSRPAEQHRHASPPSDLNRGFANKERGRSSTRPLYDYAKASNTQKQFTRANDETYYVLKRGRLHVREVIFDTTRIFHEENGCREGTWNRFKI